MAEETSKLKSLLTVSALIEAATGLGMIAAPSLIVSLLLGATLTEQSGILLGRVGGAALITLAIACWQTRNNALASIAMAKAFVFYNIAAAALLVYAAMVLGFTSIGLCAAVVMHAVMFVWCLLSLRNN